MKYRGNREFLCNASLQMMMLKKYDEKNKLINMQITFLNDCKNIDA